VNSKKNGAKLEKKGEKEEEEEEENLCFKLNISNT